MNTQAQEVPLIELLKAVPKTARLIVESEDGISSRAHPVGDLCHKAAEALETKQVCENAAPAQEPKLVVSPQGDRILFQDTVNGKYMVVDVNSMVLASVISQQLNNFFAEIYTYPAQDETSSSQQACLVPLSDDEIKQCATKLGYMWTPEKYLTFAMDTILMQFARAIEQAHGIGEKDGQAHNSSNEWNISGTRD